MAGVNFVVNDRAVLAKLAGLRDRGVDPEPVLRSIGEYLLRVHETRFSEQKAPDGTPWEPLSPRYKRRKKRNADKVLTLDGWLRRLAYQVDDEGLSLGSNRIYAATHQFGDSERNIPARPFLGLTRNDLDYIQEEVEEYLSISGLE